MDQVDMFAPSFHNTIRLRGDELVRAIAKAKTQEERVLLYFRAERRPLTPEDVLPIMSKGTPITSVRRAMTNLATCGLLRKMTLEERFSMGSLGKPMHSWELT
jgi:hypothetical protein